MKKFLSKLIATIVSLSACAGLVSCGGVGGGTRQNAEDTAVCRLRTLQRVETSCGLVI